MKYLLEKGATLVQSADDILGFFGEKNQKSENGKSSRSSDVKGELEQRIVEFLEGEPLDADTLSRRISCSASDLGTALSMLELEGFISEKSGKYYVN
jgi:predicted Rossmann fold nucleotide-binding protein DprA/Smf involved in DNA uptake